MPVIIACEQGTRKPGYLGSVPTYSTYCVGSPPVASGTPKGRQYPPAKNSGKLPKAHKRERVQYENDPNDLEAIPFQDAAVHPGQGPRTEVLFS